MICNCIRCFSTWAFCQIRKWRVVQEPGMLGTSFSPPWVSDPNIHHGTCVTHVPWCMPGSLTSGFLWSWWREKRSWHARRMRNQQFYVSGKRPIGTAPPTPTWKGLNSLLLRANRPYSVKNYNGKQIHGKSKNNGLSTVETELLNYFK